MTKKSTTSRKPRARKGPAPDSAAPPATAAPTPSPFTRDPRLPAVGTTLQRAYKGKVGYTGVHGTRSGWAAGGRGRPRPVAIGRARGGDPHLPVLRLRAVA